MYNHSIKKRIYYHDTDSGGVVYYANYLKYFEEARTEHLLSMGIDLRELGDNEGILFAVAGIEIRYKKPARYGDELLISSDVKKIKAATLVFHHKVYRIDALLTECTTTLVALDRNFKPTAIPKGILARLSREGDE